MEFVGTESFGAIQQQKASSAQSDRTKNQKNTRDGSQNDAQETKQSAEITDPGDLGNNRYQHESNSKNDVEKYFEGSPRGMRGSMEPSNGGLHDSFGMEAMMMSDDPESKAPNAAASLGASLSQSNQKANINPNSFEDQLGNEPKFSNSKNLID